MFSFSLAKVNFSPGFLNHMALDQTFYSETDKLIPVKASFGNYALTLNFSFQSGINGDGNRFDFRNVNDFLHRAMRFDKFHKR